jgi:hypothetical protein
MIAQQAGRPVYFLEPRAHNIPAVRWWSGVSGFVAVVVTAAAVACSGGGSDSGASSAALTVVPSSSPEPGCRLFFEDRVTIPNANAPLDPGAQYQRVVVGAPTRLAWLVSYGNPGAAGSSWLLFDGAGTIGGAGAPDRSGTLARLEACVRQVGSLAAADREFTVLSTPAPSSYSITVAGKVIAIPSAARVGRLSSDTPEDFRSIARGESFLNLDSAGIKDVHVLDEDKADFGPLYEALSPLKETDFLEVVKQLDELPYPALALPVDLPVAFIFIRGQLISVPADSEMRSVAQSCANLAGCFKDPIVLRTKDSGIVFQLTDPQLLFDLIDPKEESEFGPLLDALRRATSASR